MWQVTHHCCQSGVQVCKTVRSMTLLASKFQSILSARTRTEDVFEGVPLANLSIRRRGDVLSRLARNIVAELEPGACIVDPEPGLRANGSPRGLGDAEYDWLWNSRRVECKSAQIAWNSSQSVWRFQFVAIKKRLFDVLILILFTPERIYIYQHDLQLGMSTHGRITQSIGHSVVVTGPARVHDWRIALPKILSKIDENSNRCKLIADVSVHDDRVQAALSTLPSSLIMDQAYSQVPLALLNHNSRGRMLQMVVREIDGMLHPHASFLDGAVGTCIDGRRRCKANSECDWYRDGQRIECKSSQVVWNRSMGKYQVQFSSIKFAYESTRPKHSFDELLLAIYSPIGVHVLCHNLKFGISSVGLRTSTGGFSIVVRTDAGEEDCVGGLHQILDKFKAGGCEQLAFVRWR